MLPLELQTRVLVFVVHCFVLYLFVFLKMGVNVNICFTSPLTVAPPAFSA